MYAGISKNNNNNNNILLLLLLLLLLLYISKSWRVTFIVTTFLLSYIIYLFFLFFFSLFKLFFSQFSKKKKKKLFCSLLVHTYCYISSNFFSSLFVSLSLHYFMFYCNTSSIYLFYILTILLPILFCINLISFLPFNPYFSHTKMWVLSLYLSLSILSFGGFLFFLITLFRLMVPSSSF